MNLKNVCELKNEYTKNRKRTKPSKPEKKTDEEKTGRNQMGSWQIIFGA